MLLFICDLLFLLLYEQFVVVDAQFLDQVRHLLLLSSVQSVSLPTLIVDLSIFLRLVGPHDLKPGLWFSRPVSSLVILSSLAFEVALLSLEVLFLSLEICLLVLALEVPLLVK